MSKQKEKKYSIKELKKVVCHNYFPTKKITEIIRSLEIIEENPKKVKEILEEKNENN